MAKHNGIDIGGSRLISIILLVVGLVTLGIGVSNGEALVVLKKATVICLECIGLG